MKSLSILACAALLLCSACKKVRILPSANAKSITGYANLPKAEELGNPLKGTNVSWKINPLSPGNGALIVYAPGNKGGYCALMLDNGVVNGATPLNTFKFITANLQTNTSKIIEIKSKATGQVVTHSVGRLTGYCFGINKKYYLATEAGYEDGGHVIEYDPNTETAWDLGKPFKNGGKYLNIYSLNIGTDGALYGGSFGGNGDVFTFRYDYNNFYVDNTSIDADGKYVSYVSGDAKYTYASVGQNTWKLYAIDRTNGEKTLLIQSANPYERIEVATHDDAAYAKLVATHYKLNGTKAISLGAYNRPSTQRLYFTPYELEDTNVPEVIWNGCSKKLTYKFKGGTENTITIPGVTDDIYPTGTMIANNNTIYFSSAKVSELASYNRTDGFKSLGNSALTAHSMAICPSTKNLIFGGYPRGFIMEYKPNALWTVDKTTTNYDEPDLNSSQSNPQRILQFQDADAAGVFGSMFVAGIHYTKNGYLVAGGNNDRITTSSNRELSIGSYKNGIKRNLYLPEFENYEFTGMCLSEDSTIAYIAASHKYGGKGKIYTYSPVANAIVTSFDFPAGSSAGQLALYKNEFVAGIAGDFAYMINMKSGNLVWKQTVANCFSLLVSDDKTLWISYPSGTFTSRIGKCTFTLTNGVPTNGMLVPVAEIKDNHLDENTKPQGMVMVPTSAGCFDMYISGLKSLYRVNNCANL